jgi:hypothetical protein
MGLYSSVLVSSNISQLYSLIPRNISFFHEICRNKKKLYIFSIAVNRFSGFQFSSFPAQEMHQFCTNSITDAKMPAP